jgi:hypothetical protein
VGVGGGVDGCGRREEWQKNKWMGSKPGVGGLFTSVVL